MTHYARPIVMAVVAAIILAAPASASPTSPLCDDGTYRARHPLICDTGSAIPGITNGGGSGGGGGLLGVIGRVLGGLTGGLL